MLCDTVSQNNVLELPYSPLWCDSDVLYKVCLCEVSFEKSWSVEHCCLVELYVSSLYMELWDFAIWLLLKYVVSLGDTPSVSVWETPRQVLSDRHQLLISRSIVNKRFTVRDSSVRDSYSSSTHNGDCLTPWLSRVSGHMMLDFMFEGVFFQAQELWVWSKELWHHETTFSPPPCQHLEIRYFGRQREAFMN